MQKYLGQGDYTQSDFFIESSYNNTQNKLMPCYLVTRKGCEMIANKMTGKKGVQFTASYINKFHEMEQRIPPTPLPAACSMSLSGLASYIHEIRMTMECCNASPFGIAAAVKSICDSCGVVSFDPIPVPPQFEQLTLYSAF